MSWIASTCRPAAAAASSVRLAGLLEVVTLIGYYDTLDLIMSAARTPLPDGVDAPFGGEGGGP